MEVTFTSCKLSRLCCNVFSYYWQHVTSLLLNSFLNTFAQSNGIDFVLFTSCSLGGESVGIVELAPNPKVPHDKLETAKERDFKCGTIETGFFFEKIYFRDLFSVFPHGANKIFILNNLDHEYKKFLSERENPQKPDLIPMEQLIKEIDEKEKMIESNFSLFIFLLLEIKI